MTYCITLHAAVQDKGLWQTTMSQFLKDTFVCYLVLFAYGNSSCSTVWKHLLQDIFNLGAVDHNNPP
jgi:hypothetical protein